jgi:hypothetical protein
MGSSSSNHKRLLEDELSTVITIPTPSSKVTEEKYSVLNILRFCDGKTLVNCAAVSKLWNELSSKDDLWKILCEAEFPESHHFFDHRGSFKELYKFMFVSKSESKLNQRLYENDLYMDENPFSRFVQILVSPMSRYTFMIPLGFFLFAFPWKLDKRIEASWETVCFPLQLIVMCGFIRELLLIRTQLKYPRILENWKYDYKPHSHSFLVLGLLGCFVVLFPMFLSNFNSKILLHLTFVSWISFLIQWAVNSLTFLRWRLSVTSNSVLSVSLSICSAVSRLMLALSSMCIWVNLAYGGITSIFQLYFSLVPIFVSLLFLFSLPCWMFKLQKPLKLQRPAFLCEFFTVLSYVYIVGIVPITIFAVLGILKFDVRADFNFSTLFSPISFQFGVFVLTLFISLIYMEW